MTVSRERCAALPDGAPLLAQTIHDSCVTKVPIFCLGPMTNEDAVLESLAAKLNSLELTDDEKGAFGALLGVEAP